MLKRTWILLILGLIQFGCGYKTEPLTPYELPSDAIARYESKKRDFLKIEDLKIGTGPLAAWNRRIEATIDVRYADGTVIFKGPVFYYAGFFNMPDGGVYNERHLASSQPGIRLGINGMAVGGKRRFTVESNLVCGLDDIYGCTLIGSGNHGKGATVRKDQLIVEATLTESCIPTELKVFVWKIFAYTGEVICRDQDIPRRSPSDPIWRFY